VDVLILLLFVSLVLVAGALLFFFKVIRQGDIDHGDRLSLLPLEDDPSPADLEPSATGRKSST
jgi:nitrogen fixation-related uncharacterized protein